jgi:hypothetical protein
VPSSPRSEPKVPPPAPASKARSSGTWLYVFSFFMLLIAAALVAAALGKLPVDRLPFKLPSMK